MLRRGAFGSALTRCCVRLTVYGDVNVLMFVACRFESERKPLLIAERLTLSTGLLGSAFYGLLVAWSPAAGASRQAAGLCVNFWVP